MTRFLPLLCLAALLLSGCAQNVRSSGGHKPDTVALAIPEGIGVNIYFTDPQPGEMKMLAAAGFRWVRMDLYWQRIEVAKGRYDFTSYDHLMNQLDQYNIRALFILDYANKLYDDSVAPYTDEGRRAFAQCSNAPGRYPI